MKVSKKVQKKLEARSRGHTSLMNSKKRTIYDGMYTQPGSRNPSK